MPFVIPVMFRGAKSKKRPARKRGQEQPRPRTLRDFKKQRAGRYAFTWKVKKLSVSFQVVVAYKSFKHHTTNHRRCKKLLYAVWRVPGAPVEIRELYRRRFGIEASYRQLGQARIRTCTTDPVLRLFFVLVAFVLRNVWVWLHLTYFAERGGPEPTMHLERLRFRRMLNWIAHVIATLLHDGSSYQVERERLLLPAFTIASFEEQQCDGLFLPAREALTKTNALLNSLKRQKRQSKLVQTTLAALEELRGTSKPFRFAAPAILASHSTQTP